jgi:ribosomal protein S18 acetylase RimI-like enzyme
MLMKSEKAFEIDFIQYSVHQLLLEDIEDVKTLCDKCLDYMLLVDGHPADPKSIEEDFLYVPPGNSLEDKFIFGIFDQKQELVGILDTMRGYPEKGVWWIGLLMFPPEIRSQGIGKKVLDGFDDYVRARDSKKIMLGVVEENEKAFSFWKKMGYKFIYQREPQEFGNKIHKVNIMSRELPGGTN